MHVYFYLRKIDESQKHVVYLFATDRGQRYRFSTKIKLEPKYWDAKKESVKKSHPYNAHYNMRLNRLKERAFQLLNTALSEDKILSKTEFRRLLFAEELPNQGFNEFVRSEIEKMDIRDVTKEKYLAVLTKLEKHKPRIYFHDLTDSFILGFKRFMGNNLNNNPNTVNKSLSILRTFVKRAIKQGYMKENPFDNIKIKEITNKTEFLTKDEVNRLEQLYDSGELNNARRENLRQFLFAIYTGLRYSDVQALKGKNLEERIINGKRVPVLRLYQHKTRDFIEIFIPDGAIKYLPPKVYQNLPLFKQISDQALNRSIKLIMKQAGINRRITFHVSRHTFATLMVEAGADVKAVSKFMGHRSIKTTERYTQVAPNFKYRNVKQLDEYLKR